MQFYFALFLIITPSLSLWLMRIENKWFWLGRALNMFYFLIDLWTTKTTHHIFKQGNRIMSINSIFCQTIMAIWFNCVNVCMYIYIIYHMHIYIYTFFPWWQFQYSKMSLLMFTQPLNFTCCLFYLTWFDFQISLLLLALFLIRWYIIHVYTRNNADCIYFCHIHIYKYICMLMCLWKRLKNKDDYSSLYSYKLLILILFNWHLFIYIYMISSEYIGQSRSST